MGAGRHARAAGLLAAAVVCCCVVRGAEPAAAGDEGEEHVIVFSGRDLWRNGVFLHGGLIVSPGGFEQPGFLLKLLSAGGLYRYNAGDLGGTTVIGLEGKAHIAPGWLFRHGRFEAKFFFGPELQEHRLWPDDPGNRLRGRSFGLRMSVDLWAEPTRSTMLAADASLSSIGSNFAARVGAGWHVLGRFYAGPELQLYAADGYRQFRLGAHVTSLKAETIELSAAVGWSIDSDSRGSPYARLGLMQHMN